MTIDLRKDAPNQVSNVNPDELSNEINTLQEIKQEVINQELKLKELTIINELSLTVGLIMLTIGNFLGGMWANESWGRYWGWDPKETWALISILIYAFVLHMRLIPVLI